jgi:NAD(P)-dependent dehydrogenase (short-subunit alcohol dehydrogenase family)
MSYSLENKVTVVTGGTTGIDLAIAKEFVPLLNSEWVVLGQVQQ